MHFVHVVFLLLLLVIELNNHSANRHESWCLDKFRLKLGTPPQIFMLTFLLTENPRRLRPATERADIARVLSVALSYVASSLVATPKNQRKPDSASLRSFAEQRYLARCVAPRDLNRVATVS